jgi:hypothetical protein
VRCRRTGRCNADGLVDHERTAARTESDSRTTGLDVALRG